MSTTSTGYTPGSGALGAVDRIGGVDYPLIKPAIGAEGIAVPLSPGAGAVDTGTLRATLASDDPAVAALGAAGTSPPSLASGASGIIGWLRYLASLVSGYTASVSITRTADTNGYAVNDVVGAATGSSAAVEFSTMGPSGANIMITSAELEVDASAVISGETSYRLYLYSATPASALGDNAAWDLPSGDRSSFLGYVDLGAPIDLGSTLYVQTDGINKQIKLSGTSLFGYLVTIGTYTPTASRAYKVTLHTVAM